MKTDQLMDLLAADLAPVPPRQGERRFALALALGLAVSLAWVLAAYGARPDLLAVLPTAAFATKLAMPLAIGACGLVALFRLAHPGARVRGWGLGLWLPVLALWALALADWSQAAPAQRPEMLWGQTWRTCALNVALAALPVAVGLFWALKGLAPTRPALAGAVAGWLAGALGALVYTLHCPEMATPFLAVWYVLGMAVPAGVGAVAGGRWLRW